MTAGVEVWLDRWHLVADGEPIARSGSVLLPVRRDGISAMLKVSSDEDERHGGALMEYWGGDGAARVLEREEDALLMERALGTRSLAAMARNGADGEATRILCAAIAALHRPRARPLPDLVPLDVWFRALFPAARAEGGFLAQAAARAERLLANQHDLRPLHGDLHHENVLDFGPRGWLAIDPKRLCGDRAFEYAILFCDPDLSDPDPPVAVLPERFASRLCIVAEAAGLERENLLDWIIAWSGLSAVWMIEDGQSPEVEFAVGRLALAASSR